MISQGGFGIHGEVGIEQREGSVWAESVLSLSPRGALGCGWHHGAAHLEGAEETAFSSYPSIGRVGRSLPVGHHCRGRRVVGGRCNLTCLCDHSSSRWFCGPLAANKPRSWGQLHSPDKGDSNQGGGAPGASTAEPKVSGDR